MSVLILSLSSCANIPEVSYQEVVEEYKELERDVPDRVVFDFKAACNKSAGDDPGPDPKDQCIVTRGTLERAAGVITSLNDSQEEWAKAYNQQIRVTRECEYIKRVQENTIAVMERELVVEKGLSLGKQAVILGLCSYF